MADSTSDDRHFALIAQAMGVSIDEARRIQADQEERLRKYPPIAFIELFPGQIEIALDACRIRTGHSKSASHAGDTALVEAISGQLPLWTMRFRGAAKNPAPAQAKALRTIARNFDSLSKSILVLETNDESIAPMLPFETRDSLLHLRDYGKRHAEFCRDAATHEDSAPRLGVASRSKAKSNPTRDAFQEIAFQLAIMWGEIRKSGFEFGSRQALIRLFMIVNWKLGEEPPENPGNYIDRAIQIVKRSN